MCLRKYDIMHGVCNLASGIMQPMLTGEGKAGWKS